ncbi:MAG: GNAT family N-acetyltransferase [Wenzhouxiangellaceae bacterium]|nr:GNAT family N-acetyltransferase [Wenzhouxiangellaceae bacterium]
MNSSRARGPARCPPEARVEAIGRLAAASQARGGSALAQTIERAGEHDWPGLLITRNVEGGIDGSVWVQPLPGRYALVWPPRADCPTAAVLLRAAARCCDRQGHCVSQVLLAGEPGDVDAGLLARSGFPHIAPMLYLEGSGVAEPHESPAGDWMPLDPNDFGRFARLFRAAETGSLDFPELAGARPLRAVLDGFKAQGRLDPALWRLLRVDGEDAGLLILADHPGSACLELVYMGLGPNFRGRGLGRVLVRAALASAQARACRMLVALDARNAPARRAYLSCGLRESARIELHARVADHHPSDAVLPPEPETGPA